MATNASAAGSRRVLRAFLPRASAGIVAVDDVPNAPCRAPPPYRRLKLASPSPHPQPPHPGDGDHLHPSCDHIISSPHLRLRTPNAMEIKIPRRGDGKNGKEAEKPPSRLQRQAPGSLQLDAKMKDALASPENAATSAPIPLLSPLVPSPPLWDVQETGSRGEEGEGVDGAGGDVGMETTSPPSPPEGWRHPALAVAAAEPASLVPLFEFQCSMVRNVQ
ncbi:unnamed protein product [Musa banksii]